MNSLLHMYTGENLVYTLQFKLQSGTSDSKMLNNVSIHAIHVYV